MAQLGFEVSFWTIEINPTLSVLFVCSNTKEMGMGGKKSPLRVYETEIAEMDLYNSLEIGDIGEQFHFRWSLSVFIPGKLRSKKVACRFYLAPAK
jgi:hypothetical protein